MNIQTLKETFLENIDVWLKERIDEMVRSNQKLLLPSVYIKRGCHNIINKYEGKVSKGIDNAALFFADEEGNIDTETVFADAMELLKNMEDYPFDLGVVRGVIGKGRVAIALPDNILTNMVFGENKTLTLGEEDFRALKPDPTL